jgi:leucyl aminopeptidase
MKINFIQKNTPTNGTLIVFATDGKNLTNSAKKIDKLTKGALTKAMNVGHFEAKFGQSVDIIAPHSLDACRVVLMSIGKEKKFDDLAAQKIGGKIIAKLLNSGDNEIHISAEDFDAETVANIAFGVELRSYRFDKYYTKESAAKQTSVIAVNIAGPEASEAEYADLSKIAEGVIWAKNLVTEPGNVIYPESYAEEIKHLAELGVEIDILDEDRMEELGMDALLGVGQGSDSESYLAVMRWNGGKKSDAPLALIGKGVTFDTGGISLKAGAGMEDMKFDMGGSAAVVGAMKAIAGRGAKANVIGVVGLVENMPSGTAQRPGDVVSTMSGQTVEVINTDAEGRLVLCDAITYTIETYKPSAVIDLATLTGAMMVALGHEYAGIFSNNDKIANQVLKAGLAVDEPVWRMPINEGYDDLINSDIADMKNVGGRFAGATTAAMFLHRFVGTTPWVHIDIAGTAWKTKPSDLAAKGATGFGVRLLDRLVADNYEN